MPSPDIRAQLRELADLRGDIREANIVQPLDHLGNYLVTIPGSPVPVAAALAFNGGGSFAPGTRVALGSPSRSNGGYSILGTAPSAKGSAPTAAPRSKPATNQPIPTRLYGVTIADGATIAASLYHAKTGAFLGNRPATLAAASSDFGQLVHLIAQDSAGKVGPGAVCWFEASLGAGHVWDVERNIDRAVLPILPIVSALVYAGGYVYWVEGPTEMSPSSPSVFVLRQARADLSGVSTIGTTTVATVAGPSTVDWRNAGNIAASPTSITWDVSWSDPINSEITGFTRLIFPVGGGIGMGYDVAPYGFGGSIGVPDPNGGSFLGCQAGSGIGVLGLARRDDGPTTTYARTWPSGGLYDSLGASLCTSIAGDGKTAGVFGLSSGTFLPTFMVTDAHPSFGAVTLVPIAPDPVLGGPAYLFLAG